MEALIASLQPHIARGMAQPTEFKDVTITHENYTLVIRKGQHFTPLEIAVTSNSGREATLAFVKVLAGLLDDATWIGGDFEESYVLIHVPGERKIQFIIQVRSQ